MLVRTLGAAAFAVGFAATAAWADGMPGYSGVAPAFSWTGFYVGANVGYGWDNNRRDNVYTESSGTNANGTPDDEFVALFKNAQKRGAFGGGQFGYNVQHGSWVYGIEADFQGTGMRNSHQGASCILNVDEGINDECENTNYRARSQIDWFGTVRARLGLTADRTLVYVTGGLAYGHVKNSISFEDRDFTGPSTSGNKTGYVLGGGIEYAISPGWSLKAEYQYIDLGSTTLRQAETDDVGSDDFARSGKIDNSFHTVRLGLNYRFGDDRRVAPLK